MATRYLIVNSHQLGLAQSEDWWNKVLGRLKYPQDVTQFLCLAMENPLDNKGVVFVDDKSYALIYPLLTPAQRNLLDNNLVLESDPYIVAFLAAIRPLFPP